MDLNERLAIDIAMGLAFGYRQVRQEDFTDTPEVLMIWLQRGEKSHIVRGRPYELPHSEAVLGKLLYSQSYERWEPTLNVGQAIEVLEGLGVSFAMSKWAAAPEPRLQYTVDVANDHSTVAFGETLALAICLSVQQFLEHRDAAQS